ncbi:16422_t:CDS:2 [Funneliformis geosporum]|nr:16422_t:CDS:2 [Funneliformis geosporum]
MAKVATDFMKCHKWTFETPSSELAQYTKKISKSLKDDHKKRLKECDFSLLPSKEDLVDVIIILKIGVGEPQPFLSMKKDPIQAKEFFAWFQKAIPEKFTFLRKTKVV